MKRPVHRRIKVRQKRENKELMKTAKCWRKNTNLNEFNKDTPLSTCSSVRNVSETKFKKTTKKFFKFNWQCYYKSTIFKYDSK